jgi:hypothetical protein
MVSFFNLVTVARAVAVIEVRQEPAILSFVLRTGNSPSRRIIPTWASMASRWIHPRIQPLQARHRGVDCPTPDGIISKIELCYSTSIIIPKGARSSAK